MSLSEICIDGAALKANLSVLKTAAKTSVVVKGNAYGHGLREVVQALDGHVDYFQVDDVEELTALRKLTQTPALVLGYVGRQDVEDAARLGCELALFDLEHLQSVGRVAREKSFKVSIHLKVDALLGRLGTLPDQIPDLLEELERWPELKLTAVYAHYANIEDTTDLTHAEAQRDLLGKVEDLLRAHGTDAMSHISATSGLMTLEVGQPRGLVRIGIGVYGMYPSGPLARTRQSLGLKPALAWVSHLAQVKMLPAKHPVGYGLTYVTSKPTRIGIVPQGYSDGFDRGLSNSGEVLVRGVRCPVLGRIAMNMFAVDLSLVAGAEREDEVVLIGRQGREEILAEELAAKLGTINYEITSRISPLLPRILV
jgi:alanine racemase